MKKLFLAIIVYGLFAFSGCGPSSEEKAKMTKESGEAVDRMMNALESEIINIELKDLMKIFNSGSEKEVFKAKRDYVGKTLRVKGRTSGIDKNGKLTMQVESFDNGLFCYGLPDNFLLSIEEDDIVEITGEFKTEDFFIGTICNLNNCSQYKIITHAKKKKK